MNNIQEKDWAEDGWSGHTGMGSFSDYSIAGDEADDRSKDSSEAVSDHNGIAEQE